MTSHWSKFPINAHDDDDGAQQALPEDVPACTSCKKRKLRCSRETPTCSHCLRLSLECNYAPKQKPGLKTGALEGLTRRVAFLEQILLDEVGRVRSRFVASEATTSGETEGSHGTSNERISIEHSMNSDPAEDDEGLRVSSPLLRIEARSSDSRKRKFRSPHLGSALLEFEAGDISNYLPSQALLVKLATYFCTSFHHWIPYLHKQRLCDGVTGTTPKGQSGLLLHALIAVTLRHLDETITFMDQDEIQNQTKLSHFIVETLALREMTLESLQALIMIIFDYLNDGEVAKAWPLIGSLTRTVDYIQLTTEPTASPGGALMTPLQTVPPTHDWTALEERRRLFWVIFLFDRFCSVSTGWNTSLTSEDVHRRLPADGGYFTRNEPVTTPFFGIWSKATGQIGRSLANVPAHYNEDETVAEPAQSSTPSSLTGLTDSSKLGAFAYCVEATESLSQVTTFFLQQRINWKDKQHAISWLKRFKELDLRLVQWKMFLPPRWKDSDISQDSQVVNMDPNLTLAHITHNTSMILLHHSIAYPPIDGSEFVALPKVRSAQTCQHAAVETSHIVNKFLMHTLIPFVNTQFAFCTFIAAKALLYEHQVTREPLRPEFDRMKRNLEEMSSRWNAGRTNRALKRDAPTSAHLDQAGKYAHHLSYLFDACRRNILFTFNFYDHSCRQPGTWTLAVSTAAPFASPSSTSRHGVSSHRAVVDSIEHAQHSTNQSTVSNNHEPPLASPGMQSSDWSTGQHLSKQPTGIHSFYSAPLESGGYNNSNPSSSSLVEDVLDGHSLQDQSLANLSDTLMDAQFLNMDRVITFEDTNFYLPGDAYRWH